MALPAAPANSVDSTVPTSARGADMLEDPVEIINGEVDDHAGGWGLALLAWPMPPGSRSEVGCTS